MKAPAIGIEDFKTFIDGNYYLVDKTGLIVDLVCLAQSDAKTDEPVRKTKPALNGVTLFLRPRRFGKTLTLSMLKYFFDIDEKENAYLFDGLAISKEKEICAEFQNKFPVISLTLKDVKGRNEEEFLEAFNDCLKDEYKRHAYAKSVLTSSSDQETFDRISDGKGTKGDFKKYLSLLIQSLYDYHKVKPIVLIDEYDVPLNTAHQNKCYDYVVDIISSMFSKGLKTNGNLQAGVITGCLQIAKNQIFTGLNNPAICPVTSAKYARYFGFTKEETTELLHYYGLDSRMDDVRDNYDGYNMGKYSLYNPFSVLNFVSDVLVSPNASCKNYWVSTSGNALLKEMLKSCPNETNEGLQGKFEALFTGGSVADIRIDDTIVYGTMLESNEAIMGTLLFSGYLTVVNDEGNGVYTLRIPNREVLTCFQKIVDAYNATIPNHADTKLLNSFMNGLPLKAMISLQKVLDKVVSYHDMAADKEDFPHGFLLGILTATATGDDWTVESNREEGDGRSDITVADWKRKVVSIIEVKRAEEKKGMEELLEKGLRQIDEKRYDAAYREEKFSVLKYCVCFCGKIVKVKMTENKR